MIAEVQPTEPRERRYQPHKREGQPSPRVTVVLSAADAKLVAERATALRLSASATIAQIVADALRPDEEDTKGGGESEEQTGIAA